MKKYFFPFLVALSALSLAGAAAFFSVSGLSKLFGGAKTEVIIMASALEFAKIVTASFLHRYWKKLKWHMKTYLTIGVITVMIITSAGIYGFLSNAYSTTSGKLQNIDAQIQMVDQKKSIITSEIKRIEENKNLKSDRVRSLTNLRVQQESRVDSLYNRRQTSVAKRVESQIEQANKEIVSVNVEIDTLNAQVQRKYGEMTKMEMEILEFKNSDVNGEVGPLKYIAKLTGRDMDSVVNFFILLLIFVFDPLAVFLVIATNIAIEQEIKKKRDDSLDLELEPKEPEVIDPVELSKDSEDKQKEVQGYITQKEVVTPTKEEESNKENPVADVSPQDVISYIPNKAGEFIPEKPIELNAPITPEKPIELNAPITPEKPIVIEASEDQKAILEEIKKAGIGRNGGYMAFLEVLYKGGKASVGDMLPSWKVLLSELSAAGLEYTEKQVTDFLTICNFFKVTDMSDTSRRIIVKDYANARQTIALMC